MVVKKIATLLNVWDYKNYETNSDENDENPNPHAIMDQKELIRQMEENSDFKTENIIFAPIE